jgi:hypothetical protein
MLTRRRALSSALVATIAAIFVVFGVSLGLALDRAVHADAQSRLEREASRVARELGLQPLSATHPNASELEHLVPTGDLAVVSCEHPGDLPCAPGYPSGTTCCPSATKVAEPIVAKVTLAGGIVVVVESSSDPIDARVAHALMALVLLGAVAFFAALGLVFTQRRTPNVRAGQHAITSETAPFVA